MKRALLTTLALAGGLALSAPAFAQQANPDQGGGPQQGQGMMHHRGDGGGQSCEKQEARLAGMLAFSEKRLNITDAQRAAWNKFADQARASMKPMQDLCAGMKGKPKPANGVERLERLDAIMTARQAQLHQMVPAVKEMYGQLTPEQQKIADELLKRRGSGERNHDGGNHENGKRGG